MTMKIEAQSCPKQLCADVAAQTMPACDSDPVNFKKDYCHDEKFKRKLLAKIPVVLAEVNVQIDVFSEITLPTPAIEIKRVKKRLKLTQCRLIQNTNKVFLEGFVRKNIEYATATQCVDNDSVCGNIQHCTLDVPFRCVTEIENFITRPDPAIPSKSREFEYLSSTALPADFPEKDRLLAGDLSEFNQESFEYFNELPFCELISSTITEFDEFLNRTPIAGGPFEERTFTQFDEKMVIVLRFKIIQNQQTWLPAFGLAADRDDK
ncbi:MAG: hypothetical protein PHP51_00510 [Desulfotomaculaceae bacterium]|nr:hypothetical protein [Desulfotomaculaceae bacterium]MDD4766057.1 hypothetical protein [Desulfotomaculaceae bacterium]